MDLLLKIIGRRDFDDPSFPVGRTPSCAGERRTQNCFFPGLFIFVIYYLVSYESAQFIIQKILLLLIGFFVSYVVPKFLGSRIGGFNGDVCGASVVLVETIMLFIHAVVL